MRKRKFDELISYFNRKVADMDIDTNCKMELLGMVTALGYTHENETENRKRGKWINIRHDNVAECDQCGITGRAWMNFCFDCGADMRTPVETARDIVHKAIDNSAWSDTVDTAKMHTVVDDKYAEMTEDKA